MADMFRDTIPRQRSSVDAAPSTTVPRRHHAARQPFDRRELERAGWRTTLEYRENLARGADGRLGSVVSEWHAAGERVDALGAVEVIVATGTTPVAAWRRLRRRTERGGGARSPQGT